MPAGAVTPGSRGASTGAPDEGFRVIGAMAVVIGSMTAWRVSTTIAPARAPTATGGAGDEGTQLRVVAVASELSAGDGITTQAAPPSMNTRSPPGH